MAYLGVFITHHWAVWHAPKCQLIDILNHPKNTGLFRLQHLLTCQIFILPFNSAFNSLINVYFLSAWHVSHYWRGSLFAFHTCEICFVDILIKQLSINYTIILSHLYFLSSQTILFVPIIFSQTTSSELLTNLFFLDSFLPELKNLILTHISYECIISRVLKLVDHYRTH